MVLGDPGTSPIPAQRDLQRGVQVQRRRGGELELRRKSELGQKKEWRAGEGDDKGPEMNMVQVWLLWYIPRVCIKFTSALEDSQMMKEPVLLVLMFKMCRCAILHAPSFLECELAPSPKPTHRHACAHTHAHTTHMHAHRAHTHTHTLW